MYCSLWSAPKTQPFLYFISYPGCSNKLFSLTLFPCHVFSRNSCLVQNNSQNIYRPFSNRLKDKVVLLLGWQRQIQNKTTFSVRGSIHSKSLNRQNWQTIWNFLLKDCLRTQKLSILHYVRNKGEEAIAAILLLDIPSHCFSHNKHTSWLISTFHFRMMHFLDFWLIYAFLSQNIVVAINALFLQIFLH